MQRAMAEPVAPTLLDALARAPAAAALVVAALHDLDYRVNVFGYKDNRDVKALRFAHPQLRDAVGEATTKLNVNCEVTARPLTPRRWPRLEELTLMRPNLAALEALGAETWSGLRALNLNRFSWITALDSPAAHALAAALRRMPALRALELWVMELPDEVAQELFRASSAEATPQLRALHIWKPLTTSLKPAATRMLAASGWPLEALDLRDNEDLGAASAAALLAAPSFALRRLNLQSCSLDAASLVNIANVPRWPLEELNLSGNDFSVAAAGPALAALARRRGLRRLSVGHSLSAADFKALVEAAWPALTCLDACLAEVAFVGPHTLGAAAFAGFPALEELVLPEVELCEAGAALLAGRRWPRLKMLYLFSCGLGDAGLAALARGSWPALEVLNLGENDLGAPPTLENERRWAPALVKLFQ
jgi:hypothetical protein